MSTASAKKSAENPTEPQWRSNLIQGGPGRPKGKPNKITSLIKEAIADAGAAAGNKLHEAEVAAGSGVYKDLPRKEALTRYLTHVALQKPESFMPVLAKLLPKETVLDLDSDDEVTITLRREVVKAEIRKDRA